MNPHFSGQSLPFAPLLDRVEQAALSMTRDEAERAKWVVALGRRLIAPSSEQPTPTGTATQEPGQGASDRRELSRAIELLGRRGSAALPAAALARAVLAALHGDRTTCLEAARACEEKLGLLGF